MIDIETVKADMLTRVRFDLVKRIGIFGSVARGDFNENSDIDIALEYNLSAVYTKGADFSGINARNPFEVNRFACLLQVRHPLL